MRKQRVGGDTTLTELQLLMMLGKSVSAHAAINATNLHMRGDTAETLEPYRLYILAKLSVHADPILRPRNACCSVTFVTVVSAPLCELCFLSTIDGRATHVVYWYMQRCSC